MTVAFTNCLGCFNGSCHLRFQTCKACKCASLSDASALASPDVNVSAMSAYQVFQLQYLSITHLSRKPRHLRVLLLHQVCQESPKLVGRLRACLSFATRSSNAAVNVLPVLDQQIACPSQRSSDCNWHAVSSQVTWRY